MPSERIARIRSVMSSIRNFRMCGPGDDPDEITNVTIGFRSLLIQLKRLAGPMLPEALAKRLEAIDVEVDNVYTVYEAKSEMEALTIEINEVIDSRAKTYIPMLSNALLIDPKLIELLEFTYCPQYDLILLSKLCRETNASYSQGNFIATILLMRAVLNYLPPIFGQETFAQVVASVGRSLKAVFATLEDGLRKIADYHTHRRIDNANMYPSNAQIEPFRPQFELLLQEVLQRAGKTNENG